MSYRSDRTQIESHYSMKMFMRTSSSNEVGFPGF